MNYYVLLTCLALTFVGCQQHKQPLEKERISIKYENGNGKYRIIEVDGEEYISYYEGGIYPLIKTQNKHDYQIDVKHNTVILYDGSRKVGEFDLTAELDSLIISDNQ